MDNRLQKAFIKIGDEHGHKHLLCVLNLISEAANEFGDEVVMTYIHEMVESNKEGK